VDQFVKNTIAQVPEFLARIRKLISPHALVASYRYARFMEIVEVAKEFLLGILENCRIHLPIWFAQFLGKHEPGGL
jgi:hypothetical protein